MPRSNTSGVSNAGPVEETHVSLADGTLKEVNDMPTEEAKEDEKSEEESSSPGNNSSASSKSSETTPTKPRRSNR